MREACFCGAMGKGFREEMASEDAGRVSERRILLTMYEELLWPTLGHVHQDLAEKTSRGAMPGTDVLWGGPRLALAPCGRVILHVWEFCQLTYPLQLILPDSLR